MPVIASTRSGVNRGSTSRSSRSNPHRVPGQVVAVAETVPGEHVHEPEREGGIGPDAGGQVPVGLGRGAALARIDDDELGAAAASLLHLGPEMDVGGDEVRAPGDHQVGLDDGLRVGAADIAQRRLPGDVRARVADGAGDEPRGAEGVEERRQQPAVELALVRAVGVAEDREGTLRSDDGLPPPDDLIEGLVPADRHEPAGPLGAGATQRLGEPLGRVDERGLPVHLGADEAGRERLRRVPLDADDASAVHVGEQGAHVGAIVGAHRPDDRGHWRSRLRSHTIGSVDPVKSHFRPGPEYQFRGGAACS